MKHLLAIAALGAALAIAPTANANELRSVSPTVQTLDRSASVRLSAGPVALEDSYCSDSSSRHVACDAAFVQACADNGGTMSGGQGWGGRTCWEPGP